MDFEIKKDHVRNIQKEMNLIIKYFNKDMDILDFLKLFCDKYKSNFVDYDEKDRRNRVYEHSIRVFENMKMIVKFIDSQGIIIKPDNNKIRHMEYNQIYPYALFSHVQEY